MKGSESYIRHTNPDVFGRKYNTWRKTLYLKILEMGYETPKTSISCKDLEEWHTEAWESGLVWDGRLGDIDEVWRADAADMSL